MQHVHVRIRTRCTATSAAPDLALARRRHRRRQRHRRRRRLVFLALEHRLLARTDPLEALHPGPPGPRSTASGCSPACSAALIIRKPGAALFAELVAAVVSALVGTSGAVLDARGGLVQGLGAELVFALFLYRQLALPRRRPRRRRRGSRGGDQRPRPLVRRRRHRRSPSIYLRSPVVSGAVIAGALSWLARAGARGDRGPESLRAGRELGARTASSTVTPRAPPPSRRAAGGGGTRRATPGRCATSTSRIEPGERVLLLGASGVGQVDAAARRSPACSAATTRASRGRAPRRRRRPRRRARTRGTRAAGSRLAGGAGARRRRRRVRVREPRRAARRDLATGRVRRSTRSASTCRSTTRPRRSRAARSSGSRSPACSRCGPGSLLLDEPTANLDPDGVTEVRDAVARVLDGDRRDARRRRAPGRGLARLVDRVIVLGAGGGCSPTARRTRCFAERGAELAEAGVWVPGLPPRHRPRRRTAGRDAADRARDLAVARVDAGSRRERHRLSTCAPARAGLTGPNGAGKSTLGADPGRAASRRAAATLDATEPSRAGRPAAPSAGVARAADAHRHGVPGPEHQFLARTVRDELAVGPRALGLVDAEIERRVDELLERLRLDRARRARTRSRSRAGRSGGSPWRRCSRPRPRVLVLDEPTFGQDCAHLGRARRAPRGLARRRLGDRRDHARPRCRRRALADGVPDAGGRHDASRRAVPAPGRRAHQSGRQARRGALIAVPLVLTIDSVSAAVALAARASLLLLPRHSRVARVLAYARCRSGSPRRSPAVTMALRPARAARSTSSSCSPGQRRLARARARDRPARARDRAARGRAVRRRSTRPSWPTARADLRLPARFVLGALAGLRLVGLFLDDWRALELARRARGVADRGRCAGFFGWRSRCSCSRSAAERKLATAMEARGFGAAVPRTWARDVAFGLREWALLAIGRANRGASRSRHPSSPEPGTSSSVRLDRRAPPAYFTRAGARSVPRGAHLTPRAGGVRPGVGRTGIRPRDACHASRSGTAPGRLESGRGRGCAKTRTVLA